MVDLPPSDLTPRVPRSDVKGRRFLSIFLVFLVVAGVITVLVRTLDEASLFFYPIDEAVELRSKLGGERFRVLGNPQPDVLEAVIDGRPVVVFVICANEVFANVIHEGDPAELFRPGVPVVLQGNWRQGRPPPLEILDGPVLDGWYLHTDHMVVKHDNDYRADKAEMEPCDVY